MTKPIEDRICELERRVLALEAEAHLQANVSMMLAKIEARSRGWSESAIEDALKMEIDK